MTHRSAVLATLLYALAVSAVGHAAPRTLTIEDAVALALRANPQLGAARARLEAGQANASSTARRMLPSIHLSDELQEWNAPFAITFPTAMASSAGAAFTVREQTTNLFTASADQPLMGLLKTNAQRASLNEGTEAARAQLAASESDLRANVATQFLNVFEAQALEQIAATSARELDDQVTVAKARLVNGVITKADLLRIEVSEANAQQQGLEAHSQALTARAALFAAIGIGPTDADELTLIEPTERLAAARASSTSPDGASRSLAALLPAAQSRRPEVAQQDHLVLSAEHQRSASGYALLPDIDLEAAYQRTDGNPFLPKDSAYVGVKANWAIWEWGATELQRHAAAAEAEARRRDRDTLLRRIESELTSSVAQGEAARSAVTSAETALASAEEAYRVTDASLKVGAATTTDLLQAQSELTQARLNLTRAQYGLVLSDVAITRASGG